jgi:hypothetical protein
VGIVTLTDFLHHAGLDGPATLGERRALLRPSGRSHSLHPEVAGQIMTHPVRTAPADLHVGELVPLLSDRTSTTCPSSTRQRLVGMVTQSDRWPRSTAWGRRHRARGRLGRANTSSRLCAGMSCRASKPRPAARASSCTSLRWRRPQAASRLRRSMSKAWLLGEVGSPSTMKGP